jgi:hypothetical protein
MALSSPIKSNDVGLPDPQLGEALVVERYSAENIKAVILPPDDFAELQGELVDDEASVRRLLELRRRRGLLGDRSLHARDPFQGS